MCDCLPPSSSVGSVLSVSAVLLVPRCAAAPLLLGWVTAVGDDGLAPAVDSVVVKPRKTVEPRFSQLQKGEK